MNLQENIHRIKEMMGVINEDNSKKDLSPMIRESLNSLIERNKHIVCDVEVTAPWNRETVEPDKSFKHYKVLVTFIGGYGTKYFPATQAVQEKYDNLMDEIWETVYGFFGEPIDVYSKKVKECGDSINEGLDDEWTLGKNTVTLKELLDVIEYIPITKMSTAKLMKHAIHGDNPEEMKKIDNTDLKYPILVLLNDDNTIKYILDGHHRIQKANKYKIETVNVKLIKFSDLPKKFRKVLGGGKEEETEGVGAYAAPAFEMKPDHVHFKHQYNEGELTEKCWAGYTQKGMKTMFGKRYPNCVKKKK